MWRILIVAFGLFFVAGCGTSPDKTVVKGTITYKGQAVNGGTLLLYPVPTSSGENPARIPVTQEGSFSTSDVVPGEYKIVVQPSAGGVANVPSTKNMPPDKAAEAQAKLDEQAKKTPTIPIPEKYKKLGTTDLTRTIVKGDQTLTLELKD
jgi:hypothetical protein